MSMPCAWGARLRGARAAGCLPLSEPVWGSCARGIRIVAARRNEWTGNSDVLSNDGQYLHGNLRARRRLVCRILSGSTGSQRSGPLETGGPNELGGCDRADLPGPPGRLVSQPSRQCGAGYGSRWVKRGALPPAAVSPAPWVPSGTRIGSLPLAVCWICPRLAMTDLERSNALYNDYR